MLGCVFALENLALFEIRWKNILESGRPQIAIWRMPIACWVATATNKHPEYVEFCWYVMAHAEKPDFVFQRNDLVHLNCVDVSSVDYWKPRLCGISGSNAGYTMFWCSVKSTGYPLRSPVFSSLPHPCVALCHHIYNIIYLLSAIGLSSGGSGYFTCKQNMKLVTTKFKSGGLHEKHVVATWNVGNHLSICL